MNVLMLSKDGNGLGLAGRLQREYNSVKVSIENPGALLQGSGLVEVVPSWRPFLNEADLIICDEPGFGAFEDLLRSRGKPVIGCSKLADDASSTPGRVNYIFANCEIIHSPSTMTDNLDQFQSQDWPEHGYTITGRVHGGVVREISVTHQDMLLWAQGYFLGAMLVRPLIRGHEATIEGWFNGRNFISPLLLAVEYDAEGGIVANLSSESKLAEETLLKLELMLRKLGYRGAVSIICQITEDQAIATDLRFGFSYNYFEAFIEGLREPLTDVMFEVGAGVKKEIVFGTDIAISVHLNKELPDAGSPILGVGESNSHHIHFINAYKTSNSYTCCAGTGVVAKATAHARSVSEAQSRVYRTVEAITYIDKVYNPTIGQGVDKQLHNFRSWGWI